jgi:UDP-N-acetylglucosamine 2-epimerase (non-hydrolysing)/GDP/UDP-N,N'-diacetylbacillosamine 2-epimerase (hydrolysing)
VGALGIENIKKVPLMSKEELETTLDGFSFGDKALLVTYHPVTLGDSAAEEQIKNLLAALDEYPEYKVIFTLPNSDTDGRVIIKLINEYVAKHSDRAVAHPSLGLRRYLSALQFVKAVVGNSSSGIIEVPSFGIPTLNIGDRQRGRLAAESVVNCGTSKEDILAGLEKIVNVEPKDIHNPYEGKNTTADILQVLKTYPLEGLIQKSFYNLK